MKQLSISLRLIAVVIAVAVCVAPHVAFAQHDHDHDHDHDDHDAALHFAHPLFTESPSPDTKLRLDYIHAAIANRVSDHTLRVEGEYAFTPSVSIEVNLPLTSRSADRVRTTAVGSGEIALKLASFAAAEHGLLLGGGLGFGLPTGNDDKDIGSNHLVELEPYVDAGFMHGNLEVVGFASYSTTLHRSPTDEEDKEVAVAASLLYHVHPHVETLVELETRRAIAGEESGTQIVNGGLGIKVHVPDYHPLVFGLGARIPLSDHREFRNEIIISALFHF